MPDATRCEASVLVLSWPILPDVVVPLTRRRVRGECLDRLGNGVALPSSPRTSGRAFEPLRVPLLRALGKPPSRPDRRRALDAHDVLSLPFHQSKPGFGNFAVVRVGEDTRSSRPDSCLASIMSSAICHFVRCSHLAGILVRRRRSVSSAHASGMNKRMPMHAPASSLAMCGLTATRQLSTRPSAPGYCRCTHGDIRPF